MITKTKSIKVVGVESAIVTVETEITGGIGIHLVGLADASVKESLLRTITALQATGFHCPAKKIVINLFPADLRKTGSAYDLAIALAILAASEQEELPDFGKWIIFGELGLDGSVRGIRGAVQACMAGYRENLHVMIPYECAGEVADLFGEDAPIYPVRNLAEAVAVIQSTDGKLTAFDITNAMPKVRKDGSLPAWELPLVNEVARRALEIAAAGGHNLLMVGAPGSGKSAFARALSEILPPMTHAERDAVAMDYSAAGRGRLVASGSFYRPFRAPHRSTSLTALLGGGSSDDLLPGEVTLANKGVLYLEDLPDFPKATLDALRGPLEDKKVIISRLKSRVTMPADFQLVASALPCPCGYYGEGDRCTCTNGQRAAYLARISGPVYDRLTLQVYLHPHALTDEAAAKPEPVEEVRSRVMKARQKQAERFIDEEFKTNEEIPAQALNKYCALTEEVETLMETIVTHLGLSARAYSRILRIARTIADLDGADGISAAHVAEAASFRFLDRTAV